MTHAHYTARLQFLQDNVALLTVERVAQATLGALTHGTVTLTADPEQTQELRDGRTAQVVTAGLHFGALNRYEAARTIRVVAGALGPIVLGSIVLPEPEMVS